MDTNRPMEVHKIEVTPEMVAAGASELEGGVAIDLAEGWIGAGDVAVAVYRAMYQAKLEQQDA